MSTNPYLWIGCVCTA